MKIHILGSGCTKCKRLAQETETALKALAVSYEIEKVTDMQQIISFGVMSTPALVIDGVVKLSGRVPTQEELKKIISESH